MSALGVTIDELEAGALRVHGRAGHLTAPQQTLSAARRFIEKRAGISISEIFVAEGEFGFRQMETLAVEEASAGSISVIATGGGGLLRPQNIAILQRRGILIHLEVDARTVLLRTGDGNSRPMLVRCANPLKRIETLMGNASRHLCKRGCESDLLRLRERHRRRSRRAVEATRRGS